MYSEENTVDKIMERALKNISDDIDKREGSVIYDALSPFATEIAKAYIVLDDIIELVFPDTSVGEYLDKLAEQTGLTRNAATKAIRKGLFYDEEQSPMDVDIGAIFGAGELYYTVIEKIKTGEYKLECNTPGKIGNEPMGILLPIEYNINNLGLAKITDILIPGEDEESDEELRNRYFEAAKEKAFGGNTPDYKQETKAIEGVGAVKVLPVYNGGGTVGLIILDSEFNKATEELISKVQKTICPDKLDTGLGVAPIGHVVTVMTTEELKINVSSTIQYTEGESEETVKPKITEAVKQYFLELRKKWEDAETTVVRISQIESIILNTEGVLDISQTKINDNTSNIEIEKEKIPVLGEVSLS